MTNFILIRLVFICVQMIRTCFSTINLEYKKTAAKQLFFCTPMEIRTPIVGTGIRYSIH